MELTKKNNRKKRRLSKKYKKLLGGNNDTFGFIITRCVKKEEDNQIWINCYKSIRKFYKEKIIFITDGSNKKLIKDIPLENVDLIDSEFQGSGEILPYYYFHKLRPFKKAVCMQDSMWFINYFDFKNYELKDIVFLWHFGGDNKHFTDKEEELAKLISEDVFNTYKSSNYIGSWGGTSFLTLKFLDELQNTYNFLKWVDYLNKERTYRHSFERIFGVICSMSSKTLKNNPSLFGDFQTSKTTTNLKNINTYKNSNSTLSDIFLLKLFRGR